MIHFTNGIDIRVREPKQATVALFDIAPGVTRYCVIGTEYGHLHTTGGDVRVWRSYSGAARAARRYRGVGQLIRKTKR